MNRKKTNRKNAIHLPAMLALCASLWLILSAPPAARAQDDADRKGIEQAVGQYFSGSLEEMKKAFHPDAKMLFMRDGKLQQVTMPEWFARIAANTGPAPRANSRKITQLDIADDAAFVKAESDFPTFQFVDYLSLLKIDGQWRIVGKTFHRYDKPTTAQGR